MYIQTHTQHILLVREKLSFIFVIFNSFPYARPSRQGCHHESHYQQEDFFMCALQFSIHELFTHSIHTSSLVYVRVICDVFSIEDEVLWQNFSMWKNHLCKTDKLLLLTIMEQYKKQPRPSTIVQFQSHIFLHQKFKYCFPRIKRKS